MKKRFTRILAAFVLLVGLTIPMGMMGQTETLVSGSGTSGYTIPDGWTSSGTVEGGSYLKFDNGTITSPEFAPHNGLSFTYSVATFGSGDNHPLTIRILNASTNAVIVETTTATPTSSTYINTGSPLSLGDVTVAFKIQMYAPTGKGIRLRNYSVTGTPAGGQQLTPSDLALVDAPVELEFDLYDNANAQTISYTTSSTGAVTVSQSNYITATVNANNTITVNPVSVTNGPQTITVTQAADNTYATGSVTFTVDIEDSTPFTGGDVTFTAGTDLGSTSSNNSPDEMEKNGVTVYSDNAAFATAQYRLYQSSTTTISVESGTITKIVFNGQTTSNPVSNLSVNDNNGSYSNNNNVGTWTGNSDEVSFYASAQVRLSSIVVTVETGGTPDPIISASNVDIAYSATSGSITYTISNEPSPAGTLTAAVTDGNWLTLGQGTTSPITFTCVANETTTARTATVTLTYNYGDSQSVTKDVTVTQTAVPYTTIPALFAAATGTETPVYVTFNNWVVSGVSTNGKSVFVTDNNGNGFVIFDNNGDLGNTYTVGDILAGTAEFCSLKLYNGYAELLNVNATDLTITTGGTVTVAEIEMANLAGVNTGALVHYDNLTCSIDNNKYYLSDGTTTLQIYNALSDFSVSAGKTYNITGVYQQFNNTKEILPRSAEDIVEVQVQHNEYTLTVSNLVHVTTHVFEASNQSEALLDGEGQVDIYDGTQVLISVDVEEGYVLESLIVDNNNVTSQVNEGNYTFIMPTHAVTITATAVESVTPPTPGDGDYVRISSLDQLTNGSIVVIASRYDGNATNYRAMKNTLSNNKAPSEAFVSTTSGSNEVLPATIVEAVNEYYWVVSVNNGAYTFTNANGDVIGWGSSSNFNMNGNNTTWTIVRATSGASLVPSYEGFTIKNVNEASRYIAFRGGTEVFGPYSSSNLTGDDYNFYLDFYVQVAPETYTLTIDGYTDDNSKTGYYLIASPVTVDLSNHDMTTGDFDLYYFDQTGGGEDGDGKEWRNYKQGTFTSLVPGMGYLYAKKGDGQTFNFTLTGSPYSGDGKVTLTKDDDATLAGWNLIGNPFGTTATLNKPFYKMAEGGAGFTTQIEANSTVNAMEGVFVEASTNGETATFTAVRNSEPQGIAYLNINVNKNRGEFVDNAIVRFDGGQQLGKFSFRQGSTKVYMTENGKDYAIVRSANEADMPVSFKAEKNGTYTLAVETENMEMNYLHLIDNMTGADVDLLATPSYSFEARTTDYASRFRLVFKASSTSSEADETFAYFNGSSWTVSNVGDATLQVVDVTGRTVANQMINGNAELNLNQPAGVYVIRLVNGNNVKTQKVVVR